MKASVTLIPTLLVKQGRDDSTLSSLLATYDSGIPGMYMYAKYTHKQNDSTFTLASPSSTPKCYTLLRAELDLEVFVPAGMRAFSWPSNRYVPSEGESCSMCTSVCLCFVFVFFFLHLRAFIQHPWIVSCALGCGAHRGPGRASWRVLSAFKVAKYGN